MGSDINICTKFDSYPAERVVSIGVNPIACGCIVWHTYNLPCVYDIKMYKRDNRSIPLECIDRYWRKLNTLSIPASMYKALANTKICRVLSICFLMWTMKTKFECSRNWGDIKSDRFFSYRSDQEGTCNGTTNSEAWYINMSQSMCFYVGYIGEW